MHAGGRVTWCSVLMALGLRTRGERVVLALRVVGGEQTTAWASLLENLTSQGLARPHLVISDGSKGAEAALGATWPGIAHQRCLVHQLRNLVACVPCALRAAVVRDFRTITTAETPGAVHAGVVALRRTWATRWSAVVVSLDEAGAGLTAFTAVLWGTLASGGIRLWKLDGYHTLADTTRRQAASPGSPTGSPDRFSTPCGTRQKVQRTTFGRPASGVDAPHNRRER